MTTKRFYIHFNSNSLTTMNRNSNRKQLSSLNYIVKCSAVFRLSESLWRIINFWLIMLISFWASLFVPVDLRKSNPLVLTTINKAIHQKLFLSMAELNNCNRKSTEHYSHNNLLKKLTTTKAFTLKNSKSNWWWYHFLIIFVYFIIVDEFDVKKIEKRRRKNPYTMPYPTGIF